MLYEWLEKQWHKNHFWPFLTFVTSFSLVNDTVVVLLEPAAIGCLKSAQSIQWLRDHIGARSYKNKARNLFPALTPFFPSTLGEYV